MMQEEDFDTMRRLSNMLYDINTSKAENVINFIDENISEERMSVVFKLIMILMRNEMSGEELVKVAVNYKDKFSVDVDEIFNLKNEDNLNNALYHADFLVGKGIPKEAFKNIDQSKITGKEYESKLRSSVLKAIKRDDPNEFNNEVGGKVNSSAPKLGGKRPMTYLAWAALFKSYKVFVFLSTKVGIDKNTVKIAIKKGNKDILKKIFKTEVKDPHIYIKSLIKHHRNYIFDRVKRVSDINDEKLLEVARNNLNYNAYASLSALQ
jgi:hypothetical protein